MGQSLSIAICGCGPAGLAAACFLADAGHRPFLIERFQVPHPVGAGLLLQPAGVEALRRIGAADAALALGQKITRFTGATAPEGREIFDLSYENLGGNLHALAIHRAALFAVLWSGVARRGIAVETGCEINDLDQGSDGRLAPIASQRRFPTADLVIDATGANSPLRRFVPSVESCPYRYGAVWTTLRNRGFAREMLTQRYLSARHMIGILPVGSMPEHDEDLVTFFWSLKPADYPAFRARGLAAWQEHVARLWPETGPLIAQVTDIAQLTPARYSQLTLATPFGGRLVFVGDAAHSTSPQLGAGVTMALLDAAALTDSLARHSMIADALMAYADLRRRHVRFYQWMSRLLTPMFQSDSRMLAMVRDGVAPVVGRLPWVDRRMMELFAGLAVGPLAARKPTELAYPIPQRAKPASSAS
jgi:2-polyprenyl-6-methoxyphenol hydroxylase-like FAD-dependent oxidoreductase